MLECVLGELGEAKVGNFGLAIMKEDIGNFEISMYDIFLSKII